MKKVMLALAVSGCVTRDSNMSVPNETIPSESVQQSEELTEQDVSTIEEDENDTSEAIENKPHYLYNVEELGVSLYIPGNFYVIETDNILLDWNEETLHFSESKLYLVVQENYEDGFWTDISAEAVKEEKSNIVFAFSITPREYYPINRMCESPLGRREVRSSDKWYVELLCPYAHTLEGDARQWWL